MGTEGIEPPSNGLEPFILTFELRTLNKTKIKRFISITDCNNIYKIKNKNYIMNQREERIELAYKSGLDKFRLYFIEKTSGEINPIIIGKTTPFENPQLRDPEPIIMRKIEEIIKRGNKFLDVNKTILYLAYPIINGNIIYDSKVAIRNNF